MFSLFIGGMFGFIVSYLLVGLLVAIEALKLEIKDCFSPSLRLVRNGDMLYFVVTAWPAVMVAYFLAASHKLFTKTIGSSPYEFLCRLLGKNS